MDVASTTDPAPEAPVEMSPQEAAALERMKEAMEDQGDEGADEAGPASPAAASEDQIDEGADEAGPASPAAASEAPADEIISSNSSSPPAVPTPNSSFLPKMLTAAADSGGRTVVKKIDFGSKPAGPEDGATVGAIAATRGSRAAVEQSDVEKAIAASGGKSATDSLSGKDATNSGGQGHKETVENPGGGGGSGNSKDGNEVEDDDDDGGDDDGGGEDGGGKGDKGEGDKGGKDDDEAAKQRAITNSLRVDAAVEFFKTDTASIADSMLSHLKTQLRISSMLLPHQTPGGFPNNLVLLDLEKAGRMIHDSEGQQIPLHYIKPQITFIMAQMDEVAVVDNRHIAAMPHLRLPCRPDNSCIAQALNLGLVSSLSVPERDAATGLPRDEEDAKAVTTFREHMAGWLTTVFEAGSDGPNYYPMLSALGISRNDPTADEIEAAAKANPPRTLLNVEAKVKAKVALLRSESPVDQDLPIIVALERNAHIQEVHFTAYGELSGFTFRGDFDQAQGMLVGNENGFLWWPSNADMSKFPFCRPSVPGGKQAPARASFSMYVRDAADARVSGHRSIVGHCELLVPMPELFLTSVNHPAFKCDPTAWNPVLYMENARHFYTAYHTLRLPDTQPLHVRTGCIYRQGGFETEKVFLVVACWVKLSSTVFSQMVETAKAEAASATAEETVKQKAQATVESIDFFKDLSSVENVPGAMFTCVELKTQDGEIRDSEVRAQLLEFDSLGLEAPEIHVETFGMVEIEPARIQFLSLADAPATQENVFVVEHVKNEFACVLKPTARVEPLIFPDRVLRAVNNQILSTMVEGLEGKSVQQHFNEFIVQLEEHRTDVFDGRGLVAQRKIYDDIPVWETMVEITELSEEDKKQLASSREQDAKRQEEEKKDEDEEEEKKGEGDEEEEGKDGDEEAKGRKKKSRKNKGSSKKNAVPPKSFVWIQPTAKNLTTKMMDNAIKDYINNQLPDNAAHKGDAMYPAWKHRLGKADTESHPFHYLFSKAYEGVKDRPTNISKWYTQIKKFLLMKDPQAWLAPFVIPDILVDVGNGKATIDHTFFTDPVRRALWREHAYIRTLPAPKEDYFPVPAKSKGKGRGRSDETATPLAKKSKKADAAAASSKTSKKRPAEAEEIEVEDVEDDEGYIPPPGDEEEEEKEEEQKEGEVEEEDPQPDDDDPPDEEMEEQQAKQKTLKTKAPATSKAPAASNAPAASKAPAASPAASKAPAAPTGNSKTAAAPFRNSKTKAVSKGKPAQLKKKARHLSPAPVPTPSTQLPTRMSSALKQAVAARRPLPQSSPTPPQSSPTPSQSSPSTSQSSPTPPQSSPSPPRSFAAAATDFQAMIQAMMQPLVDQVSHLAAAQARVEAATSAASTPAVVSTPPVAATAPVSLAPTPAIQSPVVAAPAAAAATSNSNPSNSNTSAPMIITQETLQLTQALASVDLIRLREMTNLLREAGIARASSTPQQQPQQLLALPQSQPSQQLQHPQQQQLTAIQQQLQQLMPLQQQQQQPYFSSQLQPQQSNAAIQFGLSQASMSSNLAQNQLSQLQGFLQGQAFSTPSFSSMFFPPRFG